MRIAICGLVNSENLGERFISDSLICLIRRELALIGGEEPDFALVDIRATRDGQFAYGNPVEKRMKTLWGYRLAGLPLDILDVKLKRYVQKTENRALRNRVSQIRHTLWEHGLNFGRRYRRYFATELRDADAIVVDGAGLLEYSWNEYQEPLLCIVRYAEEEGLPVFFNAIGRAGEYDPLDYRCRVLMRALRSDAVKFISARDSLVSVRNCAGKRKRVKLLADAAFYVNEAFGVEADRTGEAGGTDVPKIGIGLIRGDALLTYKQAFSEEDWIELFAGVAEELTRRGYAFQFFTNGETKDQQLGEKVLARLGISSEALTSRPTDPGELLRTIAGYDALITCRMHSSIAAFTMGIPSVILSWNEKVDKYMEIIGYPDRAIPPARFQPEVIADALEAALREGIAPEAQDRMRGLALESVRGYVGELVSDKESKYS